MGSFLPIEREFAYKPKWTIIVVCAVMFGAAAAMFAVRAAGNQRGLIINGIIELSVTGATIFYVVMGALSVGFVLIAVALAYHRLTYQQRIAFTPTALIVPQSRWSQEEKIIPYQNIGALSLAQVNSQKFLYVIHSEGKHLINSSMLPSKKVFAEVHELLAQRIRQE